MDAIMVAGLICSLAGIGLILSSRQGVLERKEEAPGGRDPLFAYRLGIFLLIVGVIAQAMVLYSQ